MASSQEFPDPKVSQEKKETVVSKLPSLYVPEPHSSQDTISPSARLEEVIALASADPIQSNVTTARASPGTLYARLLSLIEADRHPTGQRAVFAAIDALHPQLNHQDTYSGLQMALKLLHETLEEALDDPTVIQQQPYVRERLMAEYLGLPDEVDVEGVSKDRLVDEIKDKVGSRWKVEAMAMRQRRGLF